MVRALLRLVETGTVDWKRVLSSGEVSDLYLLSLAIQLGAFRDAGSNRVTHVSVERYAVATSGRSLALRAEHGLKRLPRSEKLKLCQQSPSAVVRLSVWGSRADRCDRSGFPSLMRARVMQESSLFC